MVVLTEDSLIFKIVVHTFKHGIKHHVFTRKVAVHKQFENIAAPGNSCSSNHRRLHNRNRDDSVPLTHPTRTFTSRLLRFNLPSRSFLVCELVGSDDIVVRKQFSSHRCCRQCLESCSAETEKTLKSTSGRANAKD